MKLDTLKKRLKGFGRVRNMQSPSYSGGDVPNQFIIEFDNGKVFQSYNTIIAVEIQQPDKRTTYLTKAWDYSTTTGKYRNVFLNEKKAETEKKIKNGEYKLVD